MTIVIALIVGLGTFVQSAIALSGTFVWITLAVAVLAGFVAIVGPSPGPRGERSRVGRRPVVRGHPSSMERPQR